MLYAAEQCSILWNFLLSFCLHFSLHINDLFPNSAGEKFFINTFRYNKYSKKVIFSFSFWKKFVETLAQSVLCSQVGPIAIVLGLALSSIGGVLKCLYHCMSCFLDTISSYFFSFFSCLNKYTLYSFYLLVHRR